MNKLTLIFLLLPGIIFSQVEKIQEHRMNGNLDSSIFLAKQYPSTSPDYHIVLKEMAICYDMMGNYSKAFDLFTQCLASSPNEQFTSKIYNNLSANKLGAGDYSKSLEYAKRSLAIKKANGWDTTSIRINIAQCYVYLSEPDSALKYLTPLIESASMFEVKKQFDILLNAGFVFASDSSYLNIASDYFHHALEVAPRHDLKSIAFRNLSAINLEYGDKYLAVDYLDSAHYHQTKSGFDEMQSSLLLLESESRLNLSQQKNAVHRTRQIAFLIVMVVLISAVVVVYRVFKKRSELEKEISKSIMMGGRLNMKAVATTLSNNVDLLYHYSAMWDLPDLYRSELRGVSNQLKTLWIYVDDTVHDLNLTTRQRLEMRASQLSEAFGVEILITGEVPQIDVDKERNLIDILNKDFSTSMSLHDKPRRIEYCFDGNSKKIRYSKWDDLQNPQHRLSDILIAYIRASGGDILREVNRDRNELKTTVTL